LIRGVAVSCSIDQERMKFRFAMEATASRVVITSQQARNVLGGKHFIRDFPQYMAFGRLEPLHNR
jgi:hypothetical protein